MALHLVTAPTFEPVSRAEAKLHLRVDTTTDNPLIDGLILAALQHAEAFTMRAFPARTYDLKLDAFPCRSVHDAFYSIWLPKPPALSVTSVTYLDTDGVSQTWDSGDYVTDLPSGPVAGPGRIYPAYGESYPSTRDIGNAVTVRFVAGYGGNSPATISGITRSSATATATTSAAHGLSTGQRVTIKGADQDDYNGTFDVTVTGATTFTFPVVNDPATPATGSMSCAVLNIPSSVIAAMKLLIGHWYETREAVSVSIGANVQTVPLAVDALLYPYKAY